MSVNPDLFDLTMSDKARPFTGCSQKAHPAARRPNHG